MESIFTAAEEVAVSAAVSWLLAHSLLKPLTQ